jgi:hypothetical protein
MKPAFNLISFFSCIHVSEGLHGDDKLLYNNALEAA